MEPAVIGAISGAISASIAFLVFWMNLSDRITKANASAESALQVAAEAEEAMKECNGRVTTLSANFSLYREQAVEKFVTHNAITEVEKRLVESQAKTEQRLVDALDGLNKRLDRLIEAGLQRNRVGARD
ncbi:hypothetical protein [Pseudorhodoplanes sinuspersici]|uniref:Uncharacterized protein n=1 Tax=Pseudorhodoplanes sinuspersici TaxID=1235591 RepID=A0A1W6ZX30_9HYPH|nr:hypothetical protein [Pseudorhodoplanes sinuspersici]ARQ01873.1 hypothetical protein CAK95_24335 [Pseudorhodoplanes sinuspersici]RKE73638.1 hypothetical protein DFP91_1532 [Pseudorhodoplanes sinuspersici]